MREVPGRVEFAVEYKGKAASDIRSKMDEIMASRGEGLIIKHPSSKYVLNGRNMDWIKVREDLYCERCALERTVQVKPEYMVCLPRFQTSSLSDLDI